MSNIMKIKILSEHRDRYGLRSKGEVLNIDKKAGGEKVVAGLAEVYTGKVRRSTKVLDLSKNETKVVTMAEAQADTGKDD